MTSLFARIAAIVIGVLGAVVYYNTVALAIANSLTSSEPASSDMPVMIVALGWALFLFGLAFFVGMFASKRVPVILLSSVPAIIMCMPLLGAIAQEVALK